MKFKILEEHEVLTKNDAEDFIHQHCGQFIKESQGKKLYRGMKNKEKDYYLLTPRADRRPMSTALKYHDLYNKLFYEKFGWYARSEGLFVNADKEATNLYGETFYIFPFNGYKYLWSPQVYDLYPKTHSNDLTDKQLMEKAKEIINTYQDNNLLEAIESAHEIMIKCDKYIAVRNNEV